MCSAHASCPLSTLLHARGRAAPRAAAAAAAAAAKAKAAAAAAEAAAISFYTHAPTFLPQNSSERHRLCFHEQIFVGDVGLFPPSLIG